MGILEKISGNLALNINMQGRELFDVLFSLLLSIVIAGIISQIYKNTHRGMSFELSFMSTLVLLAPIVAVVMLFIRGDLVLSLGLIGSLSIIRFRAPIKDTRDMVFLFWVIATGLGCGTYNWMIVILSTILITIVMYILYFIRYGQSRSTDFILIIQTDSTYQIKSNILENTLNTYTKEARIRSHESDNQHSEIIFELRFSTLDDMTHKNLVSDLKSISGVTQVSLLAPQLALPV